MTTQPDQFHPQPPPIFDPQMGPIPPYQYPSQPNPHPNFPPHSMPSTSSAFYSPQQMHRDPMGESEHFITYYYMIHFNSESFKLCFTNQTMV